MQASQGKVKPHVQLIFSGIPSFQLDRPVGQDKDTTDSTVPNKEERKEETMERLYAEVVELYDAHNLDGAMGKVKQLREIGSFGSFGDRDWMLRKVEGEYEKMMWLYEQWKGNDDWVFDKEENGARLEYRVFEEERTLAVRISGEVELPLLPFLAIAADIDMQKEFVPFVYLSREVKQIARNRKAGYSLNYLPVLTDRECYFWATGYDRLKHKGSVFIFTETYDENPQIQEEFDLRVPPAEESDYVRLKVHYFCLEYTPITPTRATMRMWTKADLKLGFLPMIILNKAARVFTFKYFESIVEKARNYEGSEWQRRVEANPSMYRYFHERME